MKIKEGDGFIGWVYREQKKVMVKDFDRKSTTLSFYKKDEKIKSLLIVPLPERKGVLYVDSKKNYFFTEIKEKILNDFLFLINEEIKEEKENIRSYSLSNIVNIFIYINSLNYNHKYDLCDSFFKRISEKLYIYKLYFYKENEFIYELIFSLNEKEYIHQFYEIKKLTEESFIGWSVKNKSKINFKTLKNEKIYIIDKEEKDKKITNFYCFPYEYKGKNSAFGVVRFSEDHAFMDDRVWYDFELESIEIFGRIFLEKLEGLTSI